MSLRECVSLKEFGLGKCLSREFGLGKCLSGSLDWVSVSQGVWIG